MQAGMNYTALHKVGCSLEDKVTGVWLSSRVLALCFNSAVRQGHGTYLFSLVQLDPNLFIIIIMVSLGVSRQFTQTHTQERCKGGKLPVIHH